MFTLNCDTHLVVSPEWQASIDITLRQWQYTTTSRDLAQWRAQEFLCLRLWSLYTGKLTHSLTDSNNFTTFRKSSTLTMSVSQQWLQLNRKPVSKCIHCDQCTDRRHLTRQLTAIRKCTEPVSERAWLRKSTLLRVWTISHRLLETVCAHLRLVITQSEQLTEMMDMVWWTACRAPRLPVPLHLTPSR